RYTFSPRRRAIRPSTAIAPKNTGTAAAIGLMSTGRSLPPRSEVWWAVAWNKLKSLFVVTEDGKPLPDASSDTSQLDPELAKYLVPEEPPPAPPLPEGTSVGQITGTLD